MSKSIRPVEVACFRKETGVSGQYIGLQEVVVNDIDVSRMPVEIIRKYYSYMLLMIFYVTILFFEMFDYPLST